MRIACVAFGCDLITKPGTYYLICRRCKTTDPTFIRHSSLRGYLAIWRHRFHYRWFYGVVHRCAGCRRLMWWDREPACSFECREASIPF